MTGKTREVRVVGGVRRKVVTYAGELRRTTSERAEATRDYHSSSNNLAAVVQHHVKPSFARVDLDDARMVHLRNRLALKPLAVRDKILERYLTPKR
jgi:hypothetical protein